MPRSESMKLVGRFTYVTKRAGKDTKESQAIQSFCNTSPLFMKMEGLSANSGWDTESNQNLLHNIRNAKNFIIALDLLQDAINILDDVITQTFVYCCSFFCRSTQLGNNALFRSQLEPLLAALIQYAQENEFPVSSNESVYFKTS